MREIKFRFWDMPEGIMRKWEDWCYQGTAFALLGSQNSPMPIIPMQFTGLYDKSGKEIYEGDIVRFYFCADHPRLERPGKTAECNGPTEMIDEVVFDDGAFYFVDPEVGRAYARNWNNRCEIIGNIFENPDLLKLKEGNRER